MDGLLHEVVHAELNSSTYGWMDGMVDCRMHSNKDSTVVEVAVVVLVAPYDSAKEFAISSVCRRYFARTL